MGIRIAFRSAKAQGACSGESTSNRGNAACNMQNIAPGMGQCSLAFREGAGRFLIRLLGSTIKLSGKVQRVAAEIIRAFAGTHLQCNTLCYASDSQWHANGTRKNPQKHTGFPVSAGKISRYKNLGSNSFILPSTFQSLKSTLWDCLETLPINRASEHGNAKVGGGYGALGWELLALMRSSGQGVNPSWPSLCVVPKAVICAAPEAPFGRPFVILAGARSAPI